MPMWSFWRVMMGVVLCLLMQLPAFIMPSAMADGTEPPMMRMESAAVMRAGPVLAHEGRETGAMPACCQGHHSVCDAGLWPAGQGLHPMSFSGTRLLVYQDCIKARSLLAAPWRPPALLPV